ncbi:hypothetical protein [Streptococcus sp. sy010]|uniref:hypothetical protein n=1 Tax=Streptococcus sp. sy010 TaxID=2600148 RepID=UPI0011B700D3|nr:hypothetical protein [Streptococcus sp. sy010]TWT16430.1 hypothetical protein FRX51_00515 [Streptococcus sp. sy010]
MREMSLIEIMVLNEIKNRGSFERPIPAKKLRKDCQLTKRQLEVVVEDLRVQFGHPIVAKKTLPSGYYLPKNEQERQAGMKPYQKQIQTEQRILSLVMGIDLAKYWEKSLELEGK